MKNHLPLATGDKTEIEYEKMYKLCFNTLTDVKKTLDELSFAVVQVQQQTEEIYIKINQKNSNAKHFPAAGQKQHT